MSRLYPIDTPEQRELMAWRNRRIFARRTQWPRGRLEICERLDGEHPGWSTTWLSENRNSGWERPAGFAAHRPGWSMPGADEMRRDPEDGVARMPWVFGPSVAELKERIAAVEERHAAREAEEERLWRSMREGLR